MDGYPSGIRSEKRAPLGGNVLDATTEQGFREAVAEFIASKPDGTKPEQGWPWPWKTSSTTDFAYAFAAGQVWMSRFGATWLPATQDEPEEWPEGKVAFKDMSDIQKVTLGERSGLIVI